MRMNYRKRLWPVLALLPVFALAAIAMSIGLPGFNTPPAAEAQALPTADAAMLTPHPTATKCAFTIPDTDGNGNFLYVDPGALQLLHGGPCVTSADSLTVEIINNDTDGSISGAEVGPANMVVYVTGGDDFPNIQAGGASGYGKQGVDVVQLSIPSSAESVYTGTQVPGKETITVTRDMSEDGGKGDVYLIFYRAAMGVLLDASASPAPTALPALGAVGTSKFVKVEFLGDPADKLAADMMPASTFSATTPSATGQATVTLTLRDANGKLLDEDAELTVGGGADVQFMDLNAKTRILPGSDTGITTAVIEGLPRTGAVKVPVTATVGDFEIEVDIVRIGSEAAEVDVDGYACTTGGTDDTDDDPCVSERAALATMPTGDDPEALSVVSPGDYFLIAGNALDSAGNKHDDLELQWSAADAEVLAGSNTSDQPFMENAEDADDGLDYAVIQVAENAGLGQYNITVEDTDENASQTVTFTVTGDATKLAITGPDVIDPATGLGVYTVTATDANNNVPNNVVDDPGTPDRFDGIRVSIIVRAAGNPTVTGLTSEGILDFGSNGVANFTIVVPYGTRLGSPISIVASGGALNATFSATYGRVPPTLGPATGLTATSNATGTVALSWTAGPGSTRHFVAGIRKSENEAGNYANIIWTAADSSTGHTVTGLTDGAVYLFTVISGNATTWSSWHRIVEVTVNATAGGGGSGPGNPFQ